MRTLRIICQVHQSLVAFQVLPPAGNPVRPVHQLARKHRPEDLGQRLQLLAQRPHRQILSSPLTFTIIRLHQMLDNIKWQNLSQIKARLL